MITRFIVIPNVTELVGAVESTHANVSKHLRVLREAGLVARRKDGIQVFYRLDDLVVRKLCELACESLRETYEAGEDDGTPR